MRISDWSSDVCSSDLSFCIACRGESIQLVERAVQRCERYGIGLGLAYSWEGRGQLLLAFVEQLFIELFAGTPAHDLALDIDIGIQSSDTAHTQCTEIGRALCRERVWQYVYAPVVAVAIQKKQ